MYLPPKGPDQEWVGVLIAIPEPWVTELTEARRELGDTAADRVPAHLTLVPPVPVDTAGREELVTHLQKVASYFGAFRLSLEGTGDFAPISPVTYLKVGEGADTCVSLADELRTGPLDFPYRFPFHPHVTLAQGLEAPKLVAAKAAWADFSASWTVPGFRLDSVSPDGHYTSRAIFDFPL